MSILVSRRLVVVVVASVPSVAACGGNVVVDPASITSTSSTATSMSTSTMPRISTSTGGLGGATGLGGSTSSLGVGGSASCLNLPPAGTLTPCGGTATSGGGSQSCEFKFCEAGSSNAWLATCQGSTCVCSLNGQELCTCAFSQPGGACSSTGCCFQ